MGDSFFPKMGIVNDYFLGDGVHLEGAADGLARSFEDPVYVVSNYPDLYKGHPHLLGLSSTSQMPADARYLDLRNALSATERKMGRLYEDIGLNESMARAPKLYLNAAEQTASALFRRCFSGPRIGIVLGSGHGIKEWPYMEKFIRLLSKRPGQIFLISDGLEQMSRRLKGLGAYELVARPVRELMLTLKALDVVIGADTGPINMAAALGVKTLVICLERFADLYEHYDHCEVLTAESFSLVGLDTISISTALSALDGLLEEPKPIDAKHKTAIVRFRGLGDVLLTLPALATLQSHDGNGEYTYVTSPGGAALLKASGLADKVLPLDYRHRTWGYPLLPPDFDLTQFDVVCNMINRVDFIPASSEISRTELFGRLLGLTEIDYETPWKFEIPARWRDLASQKMRDAGIGDGDKVIGLQTMSEGWARNWPIARQQEFCGMASKRGWKVALLSDADKGRYPKSAFNLMGQLTVEEYAGVIAEVDVFVGPDSSGIHIAGCTDNDAIGLFGSVDPDLRIAHYSTVRAMIGKGRCVPCNDTQKNSCIDQKYHPSCMWSIKAKSVLAQVEKIYRNRRRGQPDGSSHEMVHVPEGESTCGYW